MELFASILKNFNQEPLFMGSIFIISLIGAAIAFERIRYIGGAGSIKKEDFLMKVNQYILQGNLERAIALCSQISSPLTNIVQAGLIAVSNNKSAEEVQTAMDAVALREIPKIEKRTGLLALLSNLSTLVGLLGTIAGLIGAFVAVSGVSPSEKASLLSKSIALAMNCTAFGLVVAIPLLGIYGYIQTRTQELVDDVHESAVATLNFLLSNREKVGLRK